jgi:hypothetical protein
LSGNNSLKGIITKSNKAILLGIGGGGDIVGTIPTADLMGMFGIECVFGGLSWERSVIDPMPGPRTFEEVRNARKLNEVVWFANKDTVTSTGVRFAESGVAEVLGRETLLVDIHPGPEAVAEGILDAANHLGADLIAGIDVGGDLLALGNEPGLMSPLADSIMTAAFAIIEKRVPTIMGLFGFGSDGELTQEELERSMKMLAREGALLGSWGITKEALRLLERLIAVVPTEASRMPTLYAKGEFSDTSIRSGRRRVSLSMSSTVTYYFSPGMLYEKLSGLSRSVSGAKSLEEANELLHSLGIYTEYDIELDKFNKEKGIV